MSDLATNNCEPCRSGAPLATDLEVESFLKQLPAWEVIELDSVRRLTRSFQFKNFKQALTFTNRVGELAEAEQHHPQILTEWGQVRISWWTHKIGGLHNNDFIMAARTDLLLLEN